MRYTRVLKAHVEAVKEALPVAKVAFAMNGDEDEVCRIIAEACLTALDGTRYQYAVGLRDEKGAATLFGPYATRNAAHKALERAKVLYPDCQSGVWMMFPKMGEE